MFVVALAALVSLWTVSGHAGWAEDHGRTGAFVLFALLWASGSLADALGGWLSERLAEWRWRREQARRFGPRIGQ